LPVLEIAGQHRICMMSMAPIGSPGSAKTFMQAHQPL